MEIKNIDSEFIMCDVPEHDKHKDILLNLIDKMPNTPFGGVSRTDYHLPKDFEREYRRYFYFHIVPNIMQQQTKYFKAKRWEISHAWFQQYKEGSSHSSHTHPDTNFTNVYFLELPDQQFKTSIKTREKEYDYKVKEGQIITFPAHLLHGSKTNGNRRKTIISFNSNFIY